MTVEDPDDEKNKDMTDGYKSWQQTKVRDEERPPPWRNRGSVSHGKTGQDTRAGGSLDVAAAQLVEGKVEDCHGQEESESWRATSKPFQEGQHELEDSPARNDVREGQGAIGGDRVDEGVLARRIGWTRCQRSGTQVARLKGGTWPSEV